jgi:hypothetical protein
MGIFMKFAKKFVILIPVLVLCCIGLIGCGNGSGGTPSQETGAFMGFSYTGTFTSTDEDGGLIASYILNHSYESVLEKLTKRLGVPRYNFGTLNSANLESDQVILHNYIDSYEIKLIKNTIESTWIEASWHNYEVDPIFSLKQGTIMGLDYVMAYKTTDKNGGAVNSYVIDHTYSEALEIVTRRLGMPEYEDLLQERGEYHKRLNWIIFQDCVDLKEYRLGRSTTTMWNGLLNVWWLGVVWGK